MKITLTTGDETRVSTASAIDLAGSEDNRRTDNNKERLVESSSINKSLFVLAQCVEAISKKATRIPYRESKMTRILSLGQNNGLTIMILNLAPVRSYQLDTLSSLNFANRTKKIEVKEVENLPIFKGCARPVATGASLQRQPLRPLTSAIHNANVRKPAETTAKTNGKPKAFSVYSDKALNNLNSKRASSLKRPSDPSREMSRPAKVTRPSPAIAREPPQTITKSAIEDMVEKKVSEILAARTMNQTVPAPAEISDEVKRRLESLEQRIESQDDSRTEGLNYLLMAKQHHSRGEDASALKMYELAQQFFPENAKLEAKISKLSQKIQDKRELGHNSAVRPLSLAKTPIQSLHTCKRSREAAEDSDYLEEQGDTYSNGAGSDYNSKPNSKAKKMRVKVVPLALDEEGPQTPRTKQLLSIVNSHDLSQIRLLRGVGAKKAESIVEALRTGAESVAFTEVGSLGQLISVKGISARAVENMRTGLTVGENDDH